MYTNKSRLGGGKATLIRLGVGNTLQICDVEGRQPAYLVPFLPSGDQPASLSDSQSPLKITKGEGNAAEGEYPSQVITEVITHKDGADEDGRVVDNALNALGVKLGGVVKGYKLFSADGKSGESVTLEATQLVACVVLTLPKGLKLTEDVIDLDENTPATELELSVTRSSDGTPPLPEPLATPRFEVRVNRSTAQAYRVKAGEYIQIIDVEGRQCSDFLAFDGQKMDKGTEVDLDFTTTRTLNGVCFPRGCSLVKFFYNQNMQPMVELVRDTVGRHDMFVLACTSKYYNDMGYPGHPNCTDNFNAALQPYGVKSRAGWNAINFFYNNSGDSATNTMVMDEPWSRPGDYVLLRACVDLVCASSACPDDIDPANGWNPTDIHVRVYPSDCNFSRAIVNRPTPDSPPVYSKETAFHPCTSKLTRSFTEYRGFWLPTSYTGEGAIAEYWAAREGVVMMDLSPLRKFEVLGPDAEKLLQKAATRDVRKLGVGQVVYTAFCYDHGGMIDDGTIFRLGKDNFRVVCGEEFLGVWLRQLATRENFAKVWVKSATDDLHNVAVQGPNSRNTLKKVVTTPPGRPTMDELGWFKFTVGRVGPTLVPVVISRTGYTGELGFEVWCNPRDAVAVWDAIWEAGKEYNIKPCGLDALDMLRIEAGLIFANYDFSDQTDPFEAGIGFTTPLISKTDDFVGKAALVRRKASPQKQLVGLIVDTSEAVGHGDCVHVEGGRAQIGVVTSGMRSPVLGNKVICLARVDVTYTALGTVLEIGKLDGQQKRLKATVVKFPHYDPDKSRVKA